MKKYALITGASKGIGKAIALKFAEENINIGIVGRNKKDLSGVAEEIKKIGVDCDVFVNDISRADEVKKLAEELFIPIKIKHFFSTFIIFNSIILLLLTRN